jgi:hypothetical protein
MRRVQPFRKEPAPNNVSYVNFGRGETLKATHAEVCIAAATASFPGQSDAQSSRRIGNCNWENSALKGGNKLGLYSHRCTGNDLIDD